MWPLRIRDLKNKYYNWIWHLFICVVLTVVAIVVSFEITKDLVLGDVDDRIRLTANYLEVDATLRTVTVDWFPQPLDCSSNPEMVVNLFVDPNLLVPPGVSSLSTARPWTPIFQLNTSEGCIRTNYDSFPVFRTVFKLTGLGGSDQLTARTGSLQAYPYDENFDVILDKAHSINDNDGILLYFNVSRSTAVIGLVMTISVANWLVTIAFLWITVAAFMWDKDIVAEMFVLPIATLFAFIAVRSNLPGAPAGFGAVVDYYGILPNLGLITLFTAVLLFGVLYRRIASSISARSNRTPASPDIPMIPTEQGGGHQSERDNGYQSLAGRSTSNLQEH
ncbi:hypothetical protein B0H13DRAFT_1849484 [Mycena leptocephala]|nr:hypothetical protein B0H13DRAFT_1849484 [Mycena leptocephala]